MTEGDVYIGPLGHGSKGDIVKAYYEQCGLETIGPLHFRANDVANRIPVQRILKFGHLGELLDQILASTRWVQVIVNHGDPDAGLIMPVKKNGPNLNTGLVISDLALLAIDQAKHPAVPITEADPKFKNLIKDLGLKMGLKAAELLSLVTKFSQIHRQGCIIEIRGCRLAKNVSDPVFGGTDLLGEYRKAFGRMTSAPICWMLYVEIPVHKPLKKQKIATLKTQKPPSPNRRRTFEEDGKPVSGPLVMDIGRSSSPEGHTTRVESEGIMDKPENAINWAMRFLDKWHGTSNSKFVVPVMWDNDEPIYHLPKEPSWCGKLRCIP